MVSTNNDFIMTSTSFIVLHSWIKKVVNKMSIYLGVLTTFKLISFIVSYDISSF